MRPRIYQFSRTSSCPAAWIFVLWLSFLGRAAEGEPPIPASAPELFRGHLADYDSELRGPDGRVDIGAMVTRLRALGVTTYYWLIWHAATDWDDLKLFLP